MNKTEDFDSLSDIEKRRTIATNRLKSFFRRLERNGMVQKDIVSVFIGDIIALDKMATGTFDETKLTPKK